MTELCFVDTNIFVYARDKRDVRKHRIASQLILKLWQERTGRISMQVLVELAAVLQNKFNVDRELIRSEITRLTAWKPAQTASDLLLTGLTICSQHKISWWDSLIIAAATKLNCKIIYSEDMPTGQNILGIQIKNPFE